MNESIIIKPPYLCSNEMVSDFAELTNQIETLNRDRTIDKVKSCILLGFLYTINNQLASIGAVKNNGYGYRDDIFDKAGLKNESIRYHIEIGYLYTVPLYRGLGFSHKLLKYLITECSHKNIFATIANDNVVSVNMFMRNGFEKLGFEFNSNLSSEYKIQLFGKKNV